MWIGALLVPVVDEERGKSIPAMAEDPPPMPPEEEEDAAAAVRAAPLATYKAADSNSFERCCRHRRRRYSISPSLSLITNLCTLNGVGALDVPVHHATIFHRKPDASPLRHDLLA